MLMKHFPMGHPSNKFHGKHNPQPCKFISTVTKVIWSYVSKQDYPPKGENKKGAKQVANEICGVWFFPGVCQKQFQQDKLWQHFQPSGGLFYKKEYKKIPKSVQNIHSKNVQNKNTQTNVINRMINNLRPDLTTQLFNDKRIKIE